jgi:hypothetical protein
MAHNPYSAPTTTVADVSADPPMQRPRVVAIAVYLLWAEFTLGLLDSVLDWKYTRAQEYYQVSVGFDVVFVILSIWLNWKIWQGRNWARIVALVLVAYSVVSFLPQISASFQRTVLISTLFTVELLLDVAAMYLVFFPGRRWFARR